MRGGQEAVARTLTVQFRQLPGQPDLVSSPDTSFSLPQTEPSKHLWRAVLVPVATNPMTTAAPYQSVWLDARLQSWLRDRMEASAAGYRWDAAGCSIRSWANTQES